jgi:hypothetical protein
MRRDSAVVPVRVRWTANYAVKVWPDSQGWVSGTAPPHKDLRPLLTIENLYHEDPDTFRAFVPKAPVSSSPSRTYPIRVALLTVIAPAGLLFYSVFCTLSSLVSVDVFWLIVVAALVVLWYAKGNPRLDGLPMREPPRNIHDANNKSLESPAEAEGRRFSWSWNWLMTTRSPLDDVLRSFETTRPLTRPLSFRGLFTVGPGAEDDAALSDVDSERTLRADDEAPQKEANRAKVSRAEGDLEKGPLY